MRVLDDWALALDGKAREKILSYISAAEEVTFDDIRSRRVMLSSGYFRVFRLRFGYFIRRVNENHLLNVGGLNKGQVRRILGGERGRIYEGFVRKGLLTAFPNGGVGGYKTLTRLFALSSTFSKAYFDGRVTVDVKRILRLPSTLHSKVGLVATYIGSKERNLERFNPPFESAVPEFRREEVREAYEEWVEEHGDEM